MKIKRIKQTGDLIINYNKFFAVSNDRYRLLKRFIEGWDRIIIMIDTNQSIIKQPVYAIADYLSQVSIKHKIVNIDTNKSFFFGVKVNFPNNKTAEEKLLIIDIEHEQFNEDLFNLIKNYDIAVGLRRERPFEETSDALIRNSSEAFFNKYFFEESIYDSVVCLSLRCSSGIKNIEGTINEMGL